MARPVSACSPGLPPTCTSKPVAGRLRHYAALLALLLPLAVLAECRIAFDLGSSGIRAGSSDSPQNAKADLDYLTPLWAGRGFAELLAPTIATLRELPQRAGFADDCARVGGGFSAWRLAFEQNPGELIAALVAIREASGVAVLVLPQAVEGSYGYHAARQVLGERLTTSHILDIGGGSLQIAGPYRSWGLALGQKAWHRLLCGELRGAAADCALAPLSAAELTRARARLAELSADLAPTLGEPISLTAISRPVSRGVAPAVAPFGDGRIDRSTLAAAIAHYAAQPAASGEHAAYLLSDLILVEGLLVASGGDELQVAEADLSNLPGLLADDQAYAWGEHYACYLGQLARRGPAAYADDPAGCSR